MSISGDWMPDGNGKAMHVRCSTFGTRKPQPGTSSNGSVGISFNKEQNAFTMSRHGDARQYMLRMYKIGKEIYVDFGGTAKWKKLEEQPKKEGPT